jgi:hypothetical protein
MEIIERKLGKEKALGQLTDEGVIEIDPRQGAYEYLDTVVHELVHNQFPDLSEKQTEQKSKRISKSLWKIGYRKVVLK